MIGDPFLDEHFVAKNVFEIGGLFSPASIRDQMLRAFMFAERAVARGLLDGGARSLLVVGAGPTGLTAAMAAADLGVITTVVDRGTSKFGRYATCTTRDIDPTLYDWPMTHWPRASFPIDGRDMPLPWTAGKASSIAAGWDAEFSSWLARFNARPGNAGRFELRLATSYLVPSSGLPAGPDAAGLIEAEIADGSGMKRLKVGALVGCVGWGRERVRACRFRGYGFWELDRLQALPIGAKAILSGGGDGTLQDLLRVATGRSAKEAFDFVFGSEPFLSELGRVEPALRDAEEIAARALAWSVSDAQDAAIFDRLEVEHLVAIDALEARLGPRLRLQVEQCVSGGFNGVIHVAHPGGSFSQCYALNRFLSLLVLRYSGHMTRRRGTKVVCVRAADGHRCRHPDTCHGLPHSVSLDDASAGTTVETFEVVVLRHGIAGPKKLFKTFNPARVRQLLPFFV